MARVGQQPNSSKPVVEMSDIPVLEGAGFGLLVETYREFKEEEERYKAAKEKVGVDIRALLIATGQVNVGCGAYVAVLASGKTGSKLSETKLMEKGVDPEVVEACREGGREYQYVQVRARKEYAPDSGQ